MKKINAFVGQAPQKFSQRKPPKIPLIIVAVLAGVIGTYAIIHSFAASPLVFDSGGFESGTLNNWNTSGVGDVTPTVVSDTARDGTKSLRVTLTGNQGRSELVLGGNGTGSTSGSEEFHEGDNYYYSFSFYINQMVYGQPGGHNLIMQLKGDDQRSPDLALNLWDYPGDKPDHSDGGKGLWIADQTTDHFAAPFTEKQWHDIIIHFVVSNQGAGLYQVYLDGNLVASKSNINTMEDDTNLVYIKDGLYRNGETVSGTSDLRIDGGKVGTTYASVAEPSSTTPPADTTAPSVSITAPASGATVSGSSTAVTANASDDTGVVGVQFKLDGNNLGSEDTASPYSTTWNTTGASNGAHSLTAVARDAAGNTRTSTAVPVTVNNTVADTTPPDTTITSNPAASTAATTASFSFTSSEANSTFACKLDSGSYGACTSPKTYTGLSVGSHTFSVRATDPAGNQDASAATYTWNVVTPPDTTKPVVSITAPAAGATVSNLVTTTATASDDVGVTKVEFYLDGTLKMTDTASPYNYSFDSKTLVNGDHTIAAKAYDAAGNVATDTITVHVSNLDTTPPSTPSGLQATAPDATTVNLTWNASTDSGLNASGVAKYNVLRNGVVIAQPTTTSYTDLNRAANTTYSYTIQAVDGAGNVSGNSNTATITTPIVPDTTPPTVPTGLEAVAVSVNQVNVTWNASTDSGGSGIAGYNIYRNGAKINSNLVTGTSFGDAGLTDHTIYTYKIEAVDGTGNKSAQTSGVSATTPQIIRGDLTGPIGAPDGKIDLQDISFVIRNYNTTNPTADVSGPNGTPDGKVDLYDLSYIIRNYGK